MKFLVQKSVVPNSLFFLEIFIRACINSFGFALVRFHGIFLYFAGTNICDDLFSNQLQSTTSTTTSVKIWMNLLQFLWQASLSCPWCLPLFLNFGKFPSIFRFTKRVENTQFGKFTLVNLPNQEFTLVKIPQVYLPPFTKIWS